MAKNSRIGGERRVFRDGAAAFAGANPRKAIGHGLPHIDDVMLMFHMFRTETSRILRAYKQGSVEMVKAFDEARDDLRAKLKAVNLEQHIDWRDRD